MIKIEDIFKCDIGNWEAYKELLEKDDFVPVVGAGLSIDMGVVGWNELIISLAEYVFDYGKTADKTDAEIEQQLTEDCKFLIRNSLKKLEELDKKDTDKPLQKAKHVRERCDLINSFISESKKSGEKVVDLRYVFFKKLLNRGTFFSSYEAAELLQIANNDERHLMKCLHRIINKNRQEKGWKVEKDKAVYWLAEVLNILRKSKTARDIDKIADCFTTNYDDILEKACLKESVSEVKIEHLHGYFDAQEEPHDICLTLSDLLREYQDKLNDREARLDGNRGIGLMESGNTDVPFLFLGTSFSESHIGQLAKLRPSYGIAPLPDNNYEMYLLRDKMKKFMVGKDTTIFYPVVEKSHKALAILLRQLARDLCHGLWNNWFFMKHFQQQMNYFSDTEVEIVDKAMSWLKDSGKYILTIKKGNTLEFVEKEESLIYNNSGILYFICERLKEEFKRPDWAEYSEIEEIFKEEYQEDPEPLGNTIYIYRKEEEIEECWTKFKGQIENWYSQKGREGWEYKIIRFVLSDEEKKRIKDVYEKCAEEIFWEKVNESIGFDIELRPLLGNANWNMIMRNLINGMKFQEIEKDDKTWKDSSLDSRDMFEYKEILSDRSLDDLRFHQYGLGKEVVTEKQDERTSFDGNLLKENADKSEENEKVKELMKKL